MVAVERLKELKIDLPEVHALGSYSLARRQGDLIYTAGQGPTSARGPEVVGVVGKSVTVAEAREAARLTAVNLVAAAATAVSSIEDVGEPISLTVYVCGDARFTEHISVADGCAALLSDLFPHAMPPARCAIGVASLPLSIPVEAHAVFAVNAS